MRLAISNIAWDTAEDEIVFRLLKRFGVDAIDIAPGKYFPDPASASVQEITYVKDWWAERGIAITGMQALLFGTSGLNLFGSQDSRAAMLKHLSAVCRIGGGLGATRLVFGSPKNRDRTGLDDQQALDMAVPFFRELGGIAQSYGVIICLEPNPTCYGANFMTNSAQTAEVVRQVAHPAIKMQFDTGALQINGEDPMTVLKNCVALIGHVHASEPDLVTLGDGGTDHGRMVTAIKRFLVDPVVSIEMLGTKNELHHVSIERALRVATHHYRFQRAGAEQ
ncbi:sugar phosphate isomerase/epimerase [Pseudomonas stutzeri]|uniref:sugar phosphate isomerase/epimerase family protein n=1 Tax=Stutzerimonas stutzeri TaxID=316 RepID=UPI000C9C9EF9|nr:sugar phosphate isomerase/epimerase family protein [Stutzerimonas stutzeri]MCQ4280907.1 sugar phosphate isomerase/epimerase [Stutzerimonas stutzeri]PNF74496.1 sugar phosphate isomerase/epimerase [Stutzerimonas stutzeri]